MPRIFRTVSFRRLIPFALVAGCLAITTPTSRGQIINEDFKLLANDGAAVDYFGYSIAIDDNLVAIGALRDDVHDENSGSAYVFDASTGTEITKLIPRVGRYEQKFGVSIGIANGIVVVGAPEDLNDGIPTGAAYLFDAITGKQLAKLLAHDPNWGGEFGWSVAIHNGIVAVGAVRSNDNGTPVGAAYLFDAATGEQLAKLLPNAGDYAQKFGFSIAIDNDIVAVGATNDRDNGGGAGAAYVFDVSTGTQIAKLLPNDGESYDEFGYTVAVDNGYVAVGSRGDDDNGTASGSAYLFHAATGQQVAKFLPEDGAEYDQFGENISIHHGIVAVGATQASWSGDLPGKAYLFDAATGQQIRQMIPSDEYPGARFGSAIAIHNDLVAVGALGDFNNGATTGSAYLFDAASTGTCLDLKIENLIAGQIAQFTIKKGTRGARAVTVFGIQKGQTIVNGYAQYCATFGIKGVTNLNIIGGINHKFDSAGRITFRIHIPKIASGQKVLFQAAQQGTCPEECTSNLLEARIQ